MDTPRKSGSKFPAIKVTKYTDISFLESVKLKVQKLRDNRRSTPEAFADDAKDQEDVNHFLLGPLSSYERRLVYQEIGGLKNVCVSLVYNEKDMSAEKKMMRIELAFTVHHSTLARPSERRFVRDVTARLAAFSRSLKQAGTADAKAKVPPLELGPYHSRQRYLVYKHVLTNFKGIRVTKADELDNGVAKLLFHATKEGVEQVHPEEPRPHKSRIQAHETLDSGIAMKFRKEQIHYRMRHAREVYRNHPRTLGVFGGDFPDHMRASKRMAKWFVCCTFDECAKALADSPIQDRVLYELIPGNIPQKPYVDVDCYVPNDTDDAMDKARSQTAALVAPYRAAIKRLFIRRGVVLEDEHILTDVKEPRIKPKRPDKIAISLHITVCKPGVYWQNCDQQQNFWWEMAERDPAGDVVFTVDKNGRSTGKPKILLMEGHDIDSHVYKKWQAWQMLYCGKVEGQSRKVFRPPGSDPTVFDEKEWRKRLVSHGPELEAPCALIGFNFIRPVLQKREPLVEPLRWTAGYILKRPAHPDLPQPTQRVPVTALSSPVATFGGLSISPEPHEMFLLELVSKCVSFSPGGVAACGSFPLNFFQRFHRAGLKQKLPPWRYGDIDIFHVGDTDFINSVFSFERNLQKHGYQIKNRIIKRFVRRLTGNSNIDHVVAGGTSGHIRLVDYEIKGLKQALTLINSRDHSHSINYLVSAFDISCCAISCAFDAKLNFSFEVGTDFDKDVDVEQDILLGHAHVKYENPSTCRMEKYKKRGMAEISPVTEPHCRPGHTKEKEALEIKRRLKFGATYYGGKKEFPEVIHRAIYPAKTNPKPVKHQDGRMLIMSLNVNKDMRGENFDAILEAILGFKDSKRYWTGTSGAMLPSIVCLQEVTCDLYEQLVKSDELRDAGYSITSTLSQKYITISLRDQVYGLCTLSRVPLRGYWSLPLQTQQFRRFDLFFTDHFACVNVHLESLDAAAALRLVQLQSVLGELQRGMVCYGVASALLVGDLNTTVGTPEDDFLREYFMDCNPGAPVRTLVSQPKPGRPAKHTRYYDRILQYRAGARLAVHKWFLGKPVIEVSDHRVVRTILTPRARPVPSALFKPNPGVAKGVANDTPGVARILVAGEGRGTAICVLRARLQRLGFKVFVVPRLRAKIYCDAPTDGTTDDAGHKLRVHLAVRLQLIEEQKIQAVAERAGGRVVVLCEASVLDHSLSFKDPSDLWPVIQHECGRTHKQILDSFHSVLHIQTTDTDPEAQMVCKEYGALYSAHSSYFLVPSAKTFQASMDSVLSIIAKRLLLPENSLCQRRSRHLVKAVALDTVLEHVDKVGVRETQMKYHRAGPLHKKYSEEFCSGDVHPGWSVRRRSSVRINTHGSCLDRARDWHSHELRRENDTDIASLKPFAPNSATAVTPSEYRKLLQSSPSGYSLYRKLTYHFHLGGHYYELLRFEIFEDDISEWVEEIPQMILDLKVIGDKHVTVPDWITLL